MKDTKPPTRSAILERAMALAQQAMSDTSNPGICIACGHEQDGCEPDARNYECEECGRNQVFGAEEAVLTLA